MAGMGVRSWLAAVAAIAVLSGCQHARKTQNFPPRPPACNPGEICPLSAGEPDTRTTGSIPDASQREASQAPGGPPSGSPGTITLADAVRRTLARSPDVGIADAQTKQSLHAIDMARSAMRPIVEVSGATGIEGLVNRTESVSGVDRQEAALSVRYTLFDAGASRRETARQHHLYQSAVFRMSDTVAKTVLQVVEAYLSIFEIDEYIVAAERNVEAHERIMALIKANEAEGNGTIADVQRVSTRLDKARTGLIDLKSNREDVAEAFRRLTKIAPDNLVEPEPRRRTELTDEEIDIVIDSSPQIRSYLADLASLDDMAAAIRAGRKPKVTFEVNGNLRRDVGGLTGEAQDVRSMLNLRHTLYDGGYASASLDQVFERYRETEFRLRKAREEMREEMRNNFRTAETGQTKKESLDNRLTSARKVLELYIDQFRGGERTIFELLDAQQDVFSAESDSIASRWETQRNEYRNLALAGSITRVVTGSKDGTMGGIKVR